MTDRQVTIQRETQGSLTHFMLGFTLISFTMSVHHSLYEVLVVIEEVLRIVTDVLVVDGKVLDFLQVAPGIVWKGW